MPRRVSRARNKFDLIGNRIWECDRVNHTLSTERREHCGATDFESAAFDEFGFDLTQDEARLRERGSPGAVTVDQRGHAYAVEMTQNNDIHAVGFNTSGAHPRHHGLLVLDGVG